MVLQELEVSDTRYLMSHLYQNEHADKIVPGQC